MLDDAAVERVLVVKRTGQDVPMQEGRSPSVAASTRLARSGSSR